MRAVRNTFKSFDVSNGLIYTNACLNKFTEKHKIFVKMTIIQPSHTNNLISYHAYLRLAHTMTNRGVPQATLSCELQF